LPLPDYHPRMDINFIKTASITLFVAVDPPGLAAIFLGLTSSMSSTMRNVTARRSVVIAFAILVGAALAGKPLLATLGIGIPAFRIAGGLLLFYIASEMVFERREERKSHTAEEAVAEHPGHDIAAFPLAIPLMAGPGAITATILQASAAGNSVMNFAALIAIIAVVIGSCFLVFRLANPIDRLLGATGRVVLSRLLGVLLAAMAVQIIGDGVMAFR
jgi:multiple antibiotic resistance protein